MDDRELSTLLNDAVADVEPVDRLAEIRGRTSPRRPRRGWYAVGGAMLAAAAVITAVALAGSQDKPRADDPSPIASQSPDSPAPTLGLSTYPVYYVGTTPRGLRLYREFHQFRALTEPPSNLLEVLDSEPHDPDYTSLWPAGSFGQVSVIEDGGTPVQINVTVADPSLRERPRGMSAAEAELAIQQAIYSVQAILQQRLPVQFRLGENPIDQVLGVPTSEPVSQGAALEVLSLVNISDPGEGREVDDMFTASGVANSYEATVPWQVLRDGDVVLEGFATADGWMGERLFPWTTRVDVSSLDPGTYTFRAMTSDPSDGEGPGPFEDTRTVVVR